MADLTGKQLGKYFLTARLGRGGMASVYRAYQPNLERSVAVKVIHDSIADNPEFVQRFKQEAQIIARLRHPHILQVIDFDNEDDISYMVMEYIEGGTLKDMISDRGQVAPDEALEVTAQIADALAYAHQNDMIHRDIKPPNIMFTDADYRQAVLTDFGIARILGDSGLTMSGMMIGTPAYMSPESGRGDDLDGRTDIYSLGVVFYEMLTGHVPFSADTPYAVILKHINEPLPAPQSLGVTLPVPVENVLYRMLMKDPDDRYADAAELRDALRSAHAEITGKAPTQNSPSNATPPAMKKRSMIDQKDGFDRKPPDLRIPDTPPANAPQSSGNRWVLASAGIAALVVIGGIIAVLVLSSMNATAGSEEISALPTLAALPDPTQPVPDNAAAGAAELDALLAEAEEFEADGLFIAAANLYSDAIELDADNADLYMMRGWAYLSADEPEDAISDFEQAADLAPDNPDPYGGLGQASDLLGDAAAARTHYETALSRDAEYEPALTGLGWLHLNDNRSEQAETFFTDAIALDDSFSDTFYGRALARIDLDQHVDALDDLATAIELDPDIAAYYAERARIQFQAGAVEEATDDIETAIDLAESSDAFYTYSGMYVQGLMQMGDYVEALGFVDDLIRSDPEVPDPYRMKGEVLEAMERPAMAVVEYRNYLRLIEPETDPEITTRIRLLLAEEAEDFVGGLEDRDGPLSRLTRPDPAPSTRQDTRPQSQDAMPTPTRSAP